MRLIEPTGPDQGKRTRPCRSCVQCPACWGYIPQAATRCRHCGAELAQVSTATPPPRRRRRLRVGELFVLFLVAAPVAVAVWGLVELVTGFINGRP